MTHAQVDALVIFGASGDIAAKMLFPALHSTRAAGRIGVPVFAVTRRARIGEVFLDHMGDSIARRATSNATAFALAGKCVRFEHQPGVEAAWRIVDPLLRDPPPPQRYAPGACGATDAQHVLLEGDRWRDRKPAARESCRVLPR